MLLYVLRIPILKRYPHDVKPRDVRSSWLFFFVSFLKKGKEDVRNLEDFLQFYFDQFLRNFARCRKLSDTEVVRRAQPNDTRIGRRTSVSDKFSVGQIPPSEIIACGGPSL